MSDYISPKVLTERLRDFVAEPVKSLRCNVDFHFMDELVRYPIETADNRVFEGTFCYGYQHEKYLAGLSSQIGCAVQCKFCDLGKDGFKRNLKPAEIVDELRLVISRANIRGYDIYEKPIKATFVVGGDPLANPYFGAGMYAIRDKLPVQMKVSTITPRTPFLDSTYLGIVDAAKNYPNIVQFQISLNSTDPDYRRSLVSINLADFKKIRSMGETWKSEVPNPRKVNLTFTINNNTPMNPDDIKDILTPDLFAIRLREMVPTEQSKDNGLERVVSEKLTETKKRFEDEGYMVIPGSPGVIEQSFKVAFGEIIRLYNQVRHKTA